MEALQIFTLPPPTVIRTSASCGATGCREGQLGHMAEAESLLVGVPGLLACSLRTFLRDCSLFHKSKKLDMLCLLFSLSVGDGSYAQSL